MLVRWVHKLGHMGYLQSLPSLCFVCTVEVLITDRTLSCSYSVKPTRRKVKSPTNSLSNTAAFPLQGRQFRKSPYNSLCFFPSDLFERNNVISLFQKEQRNTRPCFCVSSKPSGDIHTVRRETRKWIFSLHHSWVVLFSDMAVVAPLRRQWDVRES